MTLHMIERWCHWEINLSPSKLLHHLHIVRVEMRSVWRVLDQLTQDTCSMWSCHLAEWHALLTRCMFSVILTVLLPSFLSCAEPAVGQMFTHYRTAVGAGTCVLPRFPNFFRKHVANILTNHSRASTLCIIANVSLHIKWKTTQRTVE